LPFINIQFLSSLLFMGAFGFIIKLSRNNNFSSVLIIQKDLLENILNLIQSLLLFILYVTFFNEIASGFDQAYIKTAVYRVHDYSIISFKTIWLINYSLFFTSLLCFVNLKWVKNNSFGRTALMFTGFAVLIFLTVGLLTLSNLRDSYLRPDESNHYTSTVFNLIIRYLSFGFVALAFLTQNMFLKGNSVDSRLKKPITIVLHATILWILSSELINWMDISGLSGSYKLGITILWGVYSLAMIALGIWKKNKDLRISAIVLFGVTLAKLFLYDIASLNTISKTIVLVMLGILLLIISFLYNKYKLLIFGEDEK